MQTKICSICKMTKPIDQFYLSSRTSVCILCSRQKDKEYKVKNAEKIKKKKRIYNAKRKRDYKKEHASRTKGISYRFYIWQYNAKKRNIPWELTIEDLEAIPLKCFYTGRDLTFVANKVNTVSLDRIDSSKGYTKVNVVFCGKDINFGKQSLSVKDFIEMCHAVAKHNPKIA